MDSNTFCNNVVTIPQYTGTCWFNAILMSILYSQYSRKLLLYNNNFKNEKEPIFKILYDILYKNYISPEKAKKYFDIMRPEVILDALIPDKIFARYLITNGWAHNLFIRNFINYIGKTSILFDYYNKKFYCGISECMEFSYRHNEYVSILYIDAIRNHIHKLKNMKTNPDYIIVNLWDNLGNKHDKLFIDTMIHDSISKLKDTHTLKSFDFKHKGLNKFDNIITFNGDNYILDSCLLANYNKDVVKGRHAITGITCKNNRYVYNGWTRATIDPAKNEILFKNESLPCELMKYNWNIKSRNKFCINPLCKLDILKKSPQNNMCFSFNKGKRTLVYVKMNSNYKSIDENISSSSAKKEIKKCPSGKILKIIKVERCILKKNSNKLLILKYKNENKKYKETIKKLKDLIINDKNKINILKNEIKQITSKSKILEIRKIIKSLKEKIMKDNKNIKDIKNKIIDNKIEIDKLNR